MTYGRLIVIDRWRCVSSFLVCFILLVSVSCLRKTNKIDDIIQPINLIAGESDTIVVSDLFYSPDYPLSFNRHPFIEIVYNAENRTIILTSSQNYEGLTTITFKLNDNHHHIPIHVKKVHLHEFLYQSSDEVQRVQLFGSFNGWNRKSLPMHDETGDGIYRIRISLEPGRYEYRFMVDGREIIDPSNPAKVLNPFGEHNSLLNISPYYKDQAYLHILGKEDKADTLMLRFHYERENRSADISHRHIIALLNNDMIPEDNIQIKDNRIDVILGKREYFDGTILRIAVSQGGQSTPFQTIHLKGDQSPNIDDTPFSWHDAILYSVMVDRFFDGDPTNTEPVEHPDLSPKANFYGGDLQGVIDKLEEGYFDSLGVNVLWLFPVNQNPSDAFREYPLPNRLFTGYHGYWPIHHERVDHRFGDLDLFKTLVSKAHDRGLKILLDFVANHVHQEHPFYHKHPDWFGPLELPDGRKNIRFWDEYRLSTWFDTFLPSFDYLHSNDAVEAMTDNALWWISETGIDGFRQDAVKHIPNRFWRRLTRKIKEKIELKESRRIYQIGETFGSYKLIRSYVNHGQLDAQFNFQLYDTGIYVFLTPDANFSILDDEMNKSFTVYGMNHLMGNLMDSHDKVRYMAYTDGDVSLKQQNIQELGWTNPPTVDDPMSYERAKLYLSFILTIPGMPVLYYGDEIGMTGATDPDNRRPMVFGEQLSNPQRKMLRDVSEIIKLRRRYSALRYGDFITLAADEHVYAYLRSDIDERMLIVLNKHESAQFIRLRIPEWYNVSFAEGCLWSEKIMIEGNEFVLEAPGIGCRILRLY